MPSDPWGFDKYMARQHKEDDACCSLDIYILRKLYSLTDFVSFSRYIT
jgi:hypothetical protein